MDITEPDIRSQSEATENNVASPFADPVVKRDPTPVPAALNGPVVRTARKWWRPQFEGTPQIDVSAVILCAVVYGALFFSMGTQFLPGHAPWCTLLLWASSLIGALIAHQLRLPRVIGMLSAGLLLRNVPWNAIDAFPSKWGVQMRAGALATIFLRCGLELDFGTMKKFKYPAIKLALIPGLTEALYNGGLAVALFKMDYLLGLCLGFITKAVGPGLVVPAMFRLQKTGWGTDKGIPSTVVIAASFDDVIAITGYSIFSTIAITPENGEDGNVAWEIASGPLQVVFGIIGGVLAGFILGCTRLWDTRMKRIIGIYFSALLLMFLLEYWNLLSGGALASLFVGLVASNAWEKGIPRRASLGPSYVFSPEVERAMAVIWNWVMEPILFVTIGSTLDFGTLDSGTIPRSLIIIVTGGILRIIMTYFVMNGFGYTKKERMFYAFAWTPKATVQAALSAAPLTLIEKYKKDSPDYDQWVSWGNDILTTGLFTIIVCGTLGVIAIHYSAPLLLSPPTENSSEEEEEERARTKEREVVHANEEAKRIKQKKHAQSVRFAQEDHAHPERESLDMTSTLSMRRSASAGPVLITPPTKSSAGDLHGKVELDDYELVAEYIDAIRQLTATATSDTAERTDIQRLSDHVMYIQRRIETEVGQREPSVRELFRTASHLAFRPRHQGGPRRRGGGGTTNTGGAARSDGRARPSLDGPPDERV